VEKKPKRFWNDHDNLRTFFDEFAKENLFDPLNVTNWYSADTNLIKLKPVCIIELLISYFLGVTID